MRRNINGRRQVFLYGIGWRDAILVQDVVAGDVIVWNYGQEETVQSIRDYGGKFVEVTGSYVYGGELRRSTRRMSKTKLVVIRKDGRN